MIYKYQERRLVLYAFQYASNTRNIEKEIKNKLLNVEDEVRLSCSILPTTLSAEGTARYSDN